MPRTKIYFASDAHLGALRIGKEGEVVGPRHMRRLVFGRGADVQQRQAGVTQAEEIFDGVQHRHGNYPRRARESGFVSENAATGTASYILGSKERLFPQDGPVRHPDAGLVLRQNGRPVNTRRNCRLTGKRGES